jgi:Spy/CpxP family protein refolding chaperone
VTTTLQRGLLIGLIAFVAALAGVLAGREITNRRETPTADLHAVLHRQLDLTREQHARIDVLETRFAVRRRALELELRTENAQLAMAIEAEHGIGPGVTAAIDRSHATMGTLQKATLEHVFAMRAVLRPEQATKFDGAVVGALTADAR